VNIVDFLKRSIGFTWDLVDSLRLDEINPPLNRRLGRIKNRIRRPGKGLQTVLEIPAIDDQKRLRLRRSLAGLNNRFSQNTGLVNALWRTRAWGGDGGALVIQESMLHMLLLVQ
jgi:hypothetical protein